MWWFFLLYRHSDDGVIDDFPKISDHFPKIAEDFQKLFRRPDERSRTFFENFRSLPKTFKEVPVMFRSYTNEFTCNLRDKLDISEIIDIFTWVRIWKIRHSSPGYSFVWISRVAYFPVNHHSCLNTVNPLLRPPSNKPPLSNKPPHLFRGGNLISPPSPSPTCVQQKS